MSHLMKIAFWATVAGQIILLVAFIAVKENTLRTGTSVVLQTVPVDPLSLLQGEYVVLDYKIARLPGTLGDVFGPGSTVYVRLGEIEDGVWRDLDYGTRKPDPGQIFIKGTVNERGRLEFGIDTYFIPEGTGDIIGRAVDVKVRVAIGSGGTAVIQELLLDGKPFDPTRSPDLPPKEPPPRAPSTPAPDTKLEPPPEDGPPRKP